MRIAIVAKKKKMVLTGRPVVAQQVRSRWRFSKSIIDVAAACFTSNRTPLHHFVQNVLFLNPFLVGFIFFSFTISVQI
jgi:hypothetical protein